MQIHTDIYHPSRRNPAPYPVPQLKAPRVTPLEGVSTSTVTPVDCVHTYASALAYVDVRPQGAQPLTYAPQGIRVVWKSRLLSCPLLILISTSSVPLSLRLHHEIATEHFISHP